MESSSANDRVGWADCLLLGATALAILLTLASVLGRADSGSELAEGHVVDLALVTPLCAAVVFGSTRYRGGTKARAFTFACAIYVLIAFSLITLNIWEYNMRAAALEKLRNQPAIGVPISDAA